MREYAELGNLEMFYATIKDKDVLAALAGRVRDALWLGARWRRSVDRLAAKLLRTARSGDTSPSGVLSRRLR
jgi:hypothetical protein